MRQALIVLSLLLLRYAGATAQEVRVEIFTDRGKFEAALGGKDQVRLVTFDDIDTPNTGLTPFAEDRYAKQGILIKGQDGQYASREFGYPSHFKPVSGANMYAPGPAGKTNDRFGTGGKETTVRFVAGDKPSVVAGFGATFIDVNYPSYGPSGLTVYDHAGKELVRKMDLRGNTAQPLFVGVVAFNNQGRPVPVIGSVKLINGTGFPAVYANEGVVLDDFLFSPPEAAHGRNAAETTRTEPTSPSARPPVKEETPAPRKPATETPARPGGDRPKPEDAPRPGTNDRWLACFKPDHFSLEIQQAIQGLLEGNATKVRLQATRALAANADDPHAQVLLILADLLEPEIVDPLSIYAYTFNWHEPSAAFVPTDRINPTDAALRKLRLIADRDPERKPFVADALRALTLWHLERSLRQGTFVSVSDDLLFSTFDPDAPPRNERPLSKREYAEKSYRERMAGNTAPKPTSKKLLAPGRALPHEIMTASAEGRQPFQASREAAPRYWYMAREIPKSISQAPGRTYLLHGLWGKLIVYADACDKAGRDRWRPAYVDLASRYAAKQRYTSGLLICVVACGSGGEQLLEWADRVDPRDDVQRRRFVIAAAYFLEYGKREWGKQAGYQGTQLGDLHGKLRAIAKPDELELTLLCGGLKPEVFQRKP